MPLELRKELKLWIKPMARITDEYVKYQRYCRPNIDTSHRCVFKCPQCIRQKTTSQEQIRRSFDLEEHNFKKILD